MLPPLPSTPDSPTKKRGGRTGADGTPRSDGQVEKLNLERRPGSDGVTIMYLGRRLHGQMPPSLLISSAKHFLLPALSRVDFFSFLNTPRDQGFLRI